MSVVKVVVDWIFHAFVNLFFVGAGSTKLTIIGCTPTYAAVAVSVHEG